MDKLGAHVGSRGDRVSQPPPASLPLPPLKRTRSWLAESRQVVSGGFDHLITVRLLCSLDSIAHVFDPPSRGPQTTDVASGRQLTSTRLSSIVTAVAAVPSGAHRLLKSRAMLPVTFRDVAAPMAAVAALRNCEISLLDLRAPQVSSTLRAPHPVSALFIPHTGAEVMAGADSSGCIRFWDTRTWQQLENMTAAVPGSGAGLPISSIAVDDPSASGAQLVACNSFDDKLHVFSLLADSVAARASADCSPSLSPASPLLHRAALKGHRSKGWPIKCSMFRARSGGDPPSCMVATGSIDRRVYVYDVSALLAGPVHVPASDGALPSRRHTSPADLAQKPSEFSSSQGMTLQSTAHPSTLRSPSSRRAPQTARSSCGPRRLREER